MPCLFLNTEPGFGGKPPKRSGFRRHLAGSKMPKEGSKMPKATSRGSRSPEIKLHRRGRDLCCLRRGCGAFTAPCRLADERAVGTKSTFRLPHCEQSRCLVHSRDCGLGAVARGLPGRIGLDPMLTIAAPHDESERRRSAASLAGCDRVSPVGGREVTHSGRRSRPAVG